ncbi:MAG: family 43 glycosylhydrolase [Bacteroidales bacterium]|nr:family 43 glycosylhydrolase [Candidatus Liminaster caballi]
MKKQLLAASVMALATMMTAQNPIVNTWYTTDPAPMVHDGTMYIYTGHDEDHADFFWMQEWRVYSSRDMVNWRDHGSPLAIEDFSWGDDRAWAPQCIGRNGKFYFYVPLHSKLSGTMAIGVAVGPSPVGPFKDAIGKPLADGSWDYIDPTVFIDDDGQAWLYWGNPRLYYAKLNEDMVSFVDGVHQMDMTGLDGYTEGPWIQKRNGIYYMMYASHGIPENISYATGPSPVGPWSYQGVIMPKNEQASFTNHSGLAHYKGHDYFFYHTGWADGGGGFARSVAIKEFEYNADGTIPEMHADHEGVEPVAAFCPYARVQAEVMAASKGLKTQPCGHNNVYVSDAHNGDWIKLRNVDFGHDKASRLTIRAASALRGGRFELHADSVRGQLIAAVPVGHTGGWESFKELSTSEINTPEGVHDVYVVFRGRKGPELFTLDWWELSPKHRVVEDGGTGMYKAVMTEVEGFEAHTVFMPQDLSRFSAENPLPVMVWGNGACRNSPWEHYLFLNEIASHGYLVIATGFYPGEGDHPEGPMSSAQQQIESIDWAIAQNLNPQSPLYQKVNTQAICAAGMSCGGLQTLYNCADPRITTYMICNSGLFKNPAIAMPNMPMPKKDKLEDVHGPIIYILGGETDIAYENGMDDFSRITNVPAYAINYPVGHGGTYAQPHGGEFSIPAVAWLDWQLKGDKTAAKMFTGKKPQILKRKGWTFESNSKK